MKINEIGKLARAASREMAVVPTKVKNAALEAVSAALLANSEEIFKANIMDLSEAAGLPAPFLKRSSFDGGKLEDAMEGIVAVHETDDPCGKILEKTELSKDLILEKVKCPIGVIAIIFEARPEILIQISALCIKSGNVAILKGGKECARTNKVIFNLIYEAGVKAGLPKGFISLIDTREEVSELLKLDKDIDLLIPRGSNEFVKYIMENTHIPVMGHADGVCHVYIDKFADKDKAVRIAVDSKTQYPAVCNSSETILIDSGRIEYLKAVAEALQNAGVKIFGCEKTAEIIGCELHTGNWHNEYLDYVANMRVVDGVAGAIEHINTYGSGHTDAIVTENKANAEKFLNGIDSANCYLNCSTRFSDGFRYGFGAEIGVSTSKLHARGPVGMDGIMTYKYKLYGAGHTVADFEAGTSWFTHKKLSPDGGK